MTEQEIEKLLSEPQARARSEKIRRAENDMLFIAEGMAPGPRKELTLMIAGLLNFAETSRPVSDWKAASAALSAYKKNNVIVED